MNNENSRGKMNSHERTSEEFEVRLADEAEHKITDDELDIYWRTRIHGRKIMRRTLMLDKWVTDKFSEANIAMLQFTEYLLKAKEYKIYQQLGYSKFEDWIHNHGISKSTANSWLEIYDVFVKGFGFTPDEISKYDIKKLKIILPLAELETVKRERVEELFELILYMCESDLRLSVKEEMALTLSEAESNPQR